MISIKGLPGFWAQFDLFLARIVSVFFYEVIDQEPDVLWPLPERGNLDVNYVEPIEEIFSEVAIGHDLLEITI